MTDFTLLTNRVLNDFFDDSIFFRNILNPSSIFDNILTKKLDYPIDVFREKDGSLRIDIIVVGHDKDKIKIVATNNTLSIKSDEPNKILGEAIYRGICRKSFNYEWKLSEHYDLTNVQATIENGLLSVTIPLQEETKKHPQAVEITYKK